MRLTKENKRRLTEYETYLIARQIKEKREASCKHNWQKRHEQETGSWGELTDWYWWTCDKCGKATSKKCGGWVCYPDRD